MFAVHLNVLFIGVIVNRDVNYIILMLFNPHSLEWLGDHGRPANLVIILLLLFAPVFVSAQPALPVLTTDTKLATAGYYHLSWQPGVPGASHKSLHFELQQSLDTNFHTTNVIYRGPDRASVISGRPDGNYYYRVRIIQPGLDMSAWSEPVSVTVQHHSLKKALGFFVTGAVVFLITLLFIVLKSRHLNKD